MWLSPKRESAEKRYVGDRIGSSAGSSIFFVNLFFILRRAGAVKCGWHSVSVGNRPKTRHGGCSGDAERLGPSQTRRHPPGSLVRLAREPPAGDDARWCD
jgi:hypothetical protein